jgi:hypothetical protein
VAADEGGVCPDAGQTMRSGVSRWPARRLDCPHNQPFSGFSCGTCRLGGTSPKKSPPSGECQLNSEIGHRKTGRVLAMRHTIVSLFAILISISLFSNTGNAVNVNLTNSALYSFQTSDPGPFSAIQLNLVFPGEDSGPSVDQYTKSDELTFTLYDELGQSALFSFGPLPGFFTNSVSDVPLTLTLAGLLTPISDSDAFILIQAASGSFDIKSFTVQFGTGTDPFNIQLGSAVTGELVTTAVPEPTTLVLLLTALLGLELTLKGK